MGSNVSFFAFDQQPDLRALNTLDWLTAFRLFHRKGRPEWYLEGPSPEGESITFFERLVADHPKLATDGPLTATLEKLYADVKRLAKDPGYDDEGLFHALALSAALRQRVLYVAGNDETLDCGFICADGAIIRGRLDAGANDAVVIENGRVSVEGVSPEPRPMYTLASQEAAAFFGSEMPWPISSFDIEAEDYELIGSKGAAEPPPLQEGPDAEIWAVCTSSIKPGEKVRRYVAIIAPHVEAALHVELIVAERQTRDPIENQVRKCIGVASPVIEGHPRLIKPLVAFLSELLDYLRLLRPKPRFRQKLDFRAINRQLTGQWRRLRMMIAIRSRLGF